MFYNMVLEIKQKGFKRTKQQKKQYLELVKRVTAFKSIQMSNLQIRNKDPNHINRKVYYLLHSSYIFINAQVNIAKNKGATTRGVKSDAFYIELFGQEKAIKIAKSLQDESYQPDPTRRVMIPKPNKPGKFRPIDTPTQLDRIVQEAARGILEAVYEPEFRDFEENTNHPRSSTNFGFRVQKSCWEAIFTLRSQCQGTTWVIEGDFSGAYNNIDHTILLNLISKRIPDKKFLKLIRKFLESGIMYEGNYEHTLKGMMGTNSILSPILFNIYLFEMDKHMEETYVRHYNDKRPPKLNPILRSKKKKQTLVRNQLRNVRDKRSKGYKQLQKVHKAYVHECLQHTSYRIDTIPKRAVFTRYADDWVLAFTGSRKEAEQYKTEITTYCRETLRMELDQEKTKITRLQDGFTFLGFSVKMQDPKQLKLKYVTTPPSVSNLRITRRLQRTTSRKITVTPDVERLYNTLVLNRYAKWVNGKLWPIGNPIIAKENEYDIVTTYRQRFCGLVEYYRNTATTENTHALNHASYIFQYSCMKTIARRQKSSVSKVIKQYGKNIKVTRKFYTEDGWVSKTAQFHTLADLRSQGRLTYRSSQPTSSFLDPFKLKKFVRTKFKIYSVCCYCGSADDVQLHHMKSIKSTQKSEAVQTPLQTMDSKLNRLQVPVCRECHVRITNGEHSDPKGLREIYDEWVMNL